MGPWSLDLPRADDDPWHHWERAIDWMADLGVNVFVGSADSYLKGAGHSQCPDWPFAISSMNGWFHSGACTMTSSRCTRGDI